MEVADIKANDVLQSLEPLWHGLTATAKKLRRRLEAVLTWATVAGHRDGANPAARSGAVRYATWDEKDLELGIWTLQPGRKAAKIPAGCRPHRVPLPTQAITLLGSLPRMTTTPFIFFAPRGGPLSDMSVSAVMRRMQEAQVRTDEDEYPDPTSKRPAVPHGLRSTFKQWTAERGFPREMGEIALTHVIVSEVERAYQRSDTLERRRQMMSTWADFLSAHSTAPPKTVPLLMQPWVEIYSALRIVIAEQFPDADPEEVAKHADSIFDVWRRETYKRG